MNDEARKTLPVVIQSFVDGATRTGGSIMAASVLYTLPVVVVFILLRKHLMRGTTAGAVKG
jgi:ABC-type glycerol-3-phosphate transport system permease component